MPLPTEALRAGLGRIAEELALDMSSSETDDLLGFIGLLQRWNGVYNLTAVREPSQMLTQHLADCLAVVAPLRRRHAARNLDSRADRAGVRLLDVGSGGGLPGVVIAVLNPTWHVTCIDAVGKKAAFITQVAGELKLKNLSGVHARVEQLKTVDPFDLIVSRAFASLSDFVSLTRHLLADDGLWAAMKGKPSESEFDELPSEIDVFHVEQLTVPGLNAERCLVWMRPSV